MKNILPFYMHPSSWGKKGIDREIAEARYNMGDGEEFEAEKEKIVLRDEKEKATQAGEPWVNVIKMGINPENVVQGYFELDWNEEFVKMLSDAGITGTNDEDIVNKWFNGVCRTVLLDAERDLDYGMQQQGRDDVIVTNSKQSKE